MPIASLASEVAVVTGAGRGIGKAIANKLANLGASVVIIDIKKKEAEDTANALPKVDGAEHLAVQCDVSGADFVRHLRDHVVMQYKTAPRILVNNAGVTMDAKLKNMTEQQWDWVMDINLKGTFLMSQAFSGAMVEGGKGGSIVNISSIVGKVGNFGQCNYSASKAGVIGLTKTIARELGPKNIRVNAVLPGFIITHMTDKVPHKVLELIKAQVPLGRMGEPDDVAEAVAYLSSESARYITGTGFDQGPRATGTDGGTGRRRRSRRLSLLSIRSLHHWYWI